MWVAAALALAVGLIPRSFAQEIAVPLDDETNLTPVFERILKLTDNGSDLSFLDFFADEACSNSFLAGVADADALDSPACLKSVLSTITENEDECLVKDDSINECLELIKPLFNKLIDVGCFCVDDLAGSVLDSIESSCEQNLVKAFIKKDDNNQKIVGTCGLCVLESSSVEDRETVGLPSDLSVLEDIEGSDQCITGDDVVDTDRLNAPAEAPESEDITLDVPTPGPAPVLGPDTSSRELGLAEEDAPEAGPPEDVEIQPVEVIDDPVDPLTEEQPEEVVEEEGSEEQGEDGAPVYQDNVGQDGSEKGSGRMSVQASISSLVIGAVVGKVVADIVN